MERNQQIGAANPTRRVYLPLTEKELRTDVSEDFTLPDYQPEIRRLLRISATVCPPSKFIGTGSAEFSGTVDYTVLYLGNDGSLSSAPLSSEYRFRIPTDGSGDFDLSEPPTVYALTKAEAESVGGRVTAPRKLTVKCRLVSHVRAEAVCPIGERIQGELPPVGEQCRLTDEFSSASTLYGIEEGVTLTDEMIPDVPTDTLRILSADGRVFLSSAEAGSGAVHCRGEVILTLLSVKEPTQTASVGSLLGDGAPTESGDDTKDKSENGRNAPSVPEVHTFTRKLPLDAQIPIDGADVSCSAAAWGTCTDLSVSVEDGRILCDVGVTLEALCQKTVQNEYTKDLYAAGRDCTCTYVKRRIPTAIGTGIGNLSVGGTTPLSELGIRAGTKVWDTSGEATVVGIAEEKGKPVLTGVCRFRILTSDENGEMSFADAEYPFRYVCESAEIPADTDGEVTGDATAQMVSCRARIDGERLAADGEVTVAFRLTGNKTVQMPETVQFGEKRSAPAGEIRIYYPVRGETLWDTAKRFSIPVSELSEKNDLPTSPRADDPASLGDNRYLVI